MLGWIKISRLFLWHLCQSLLHWMWQTEMPVYVTLGMGDVSLCYTRGGRCQCRLEILTELSVWGREVDWGDTDTGVGFQVSRLLLCYYDHIIITSKVKSTLVNKKKKIILIVIHSNHFKIITKCFLLKNTKKLGWFKNVVWPLKLEVLQKADMFA